MYGVPRRRHWFLLGLLAGLALFPWAAGMSYRAAGRRLADRSLEGVRYLREEAIPAARRALERAKKVWATSGGPAPETEPTEAKTGARRPRTDRPRRAAVNNGVDGP